MIERLIVYGLTENYTDLYARYGLIINDKKLPAPPVKTRYIELPGTDIPADLSNGKHFGQRQFEFNLTKIIQGNSRTFLSDLMSEMQGKVFTFALLSAPLKQFTGRFVFGEWDEAYNIGTISLTVYVASEIAVTEPGWVDVLTPDTRAEENEKNNQRDEDFQEKYNEQERKRREEEYEAATYLPEIVADITLTDLWNGPGQGVYPRKVLEISSPYDIGQIHMPDNYSTIHKYYFLNVRIHYGGWTPCFVPYRRTRKSDGKKFYFHWCRTTNWTGLWGYWESMDGERYDYPYGNAEALVAFFPARPWAPSSWDPSTGEIVTDIDLENGVYYGFRPNVTEVGTDFGLWFPERVNDIPGAGYENNILGPLFAEYQLSLIQNVWNDGTDAGKTNYASGMLPPGVPADWWMWFSFGGFTGSELTDWEDYVFRIGNATYMNDHRAIRSPQHTGYTWKGSANNPITFDSSHDGYLIVPNYPKRYSSLAGGGYKQGLSLMCFKTTETVRPRFEFVQATRVSDGQVFVGQAAYDAGFRDVKLATTTNEKSLPDFNSDLRVTFNGYYSQPFRYGVSYTYYDFEWTDAVYRVYDGAHA